MESTAVLRSFHYSVGTVSHTRSLTERPTLFASGKLQIHGSAVAGKISSSPMKRKATLISCAKAQETAAAAKADDGNLQGSVNKNTLRSATFPNGFEALVLEVCDETEIAELKLKVGDFQMHLKRNVGVTQTSSAIISPTSPPPIPTEPMVKSTPAPTPSPPPKTTSEKMSPFINVSREKLSKLKAFEASGATGYVLVSSPTVGSFRRGRTLKGKRQPPICKEGDVIKEGQTIGFVDQFGTELPIKSDAAGEVLKLLFNDGEAVGYGDPLIAVLPSFHGIQ